MSYATQAQMLEEFDGENVFQGRVIEVHIGTLPPARRSRSPTGPLR